MSPARSGRCTDAVRERPRRRVVRVLSAADRLQRQRPGERDRAERDGGRGAHGSRRDLKGRADRTRGRECLALLPSGSDAVHRLPLRGARPARECSLRARERLRRLLAGGGAPRVGWRDGDEVVDLSGLGDVFARAVARMRSWPRARPRGATLSPPRSAHDGPRAPLAQACAAPPFDGRGLRRLLLVARARDEHGPAVPSRRASRCFRTGAGCRSPTTAARARSSSAAPTSSGRTAS